MRLLADSAATEASKTTLSVVASSVKQPEFPKPNSTKRTQKPKAYTALLLSRGKAERAALA